MIVKRFSLDEFLVGALNALPAKEIVIDGDRQELIAFIDEKQAELWVEL